MKFLVISNPKHPVPPEIGPTLVDAMSAWVKQHTASGKIESTWSFAGTAGGGGIVNVDSPEELDAIMVAFPFGAFSEVEIYPLVDLHEALHRSKQAMLAMAGG
jgi:muconolactone delta-isomerase